MTKLEEALRANLGKLQGISTIQEKRSRSRERKTHTGEEVSKKLKKAKKGKKKFRQKTSAKVQVTKRVRPADQNSLEGRLDMVHKHENGKLVVSSDSSAQARSDESLENLNDISHISEKMEKLHSAAHSIQKVWRNFASRKRSDLVLESSKHHESSAKKKPAPKSAEKPRPPKKLPESTPASPKLEAAAPKESPQLSEIVGTLLLPRLLPEPRLGPAAQVERDTRDR